MIDPLSDNPSSPSPPPPPPPHGRADIRARRPETLPILAALLVAAALIAQGSDWLAQWYVPPPSHDEAPFIIWLFSAEAEAIALPLAQFRADHPGVNIVVRKFEWDFPLLEQMPLHNGMEQPSLIQMGTTWLPAAARAGLVIPLDSLLDRSNIGEEIFHPEAWRTCVFDSRTYGVPWYMEDRCLIYRTDMLPRAPVSWDDFRAWKPLVAPNKPLLLPHGEWSVFGIFLFQEGADPLKPLSPEWVRALDQYMSFFKDGTTIYGDTLAEFHHLDAFAEGRYAAFVAGPWIVPILEKNYSKLADSWTVVPLPALRGRNTSLLGGSNWVIPTRAPKAELAWDFIEQMSRPGAQAEWKRISGGLPAVRKAWRFDHEEGSTGRAAFQGQLSDVRAAPISPAWERIEHRYAEILKDVIGDTMTPAEARAALAKEME